MNISIHIGQQKMAKHKVQKLPKYKKKINNKINKNNKDEFKTNKLSFSQHPLSNVPREELIKSLIQLGEQNKIDFSIKLIEIKKLFVTLEPLQALSSLSMYGLTSSVDDKGNISHGYLGEQFNQSHVELAQALFLMIGLNESQARPTPENIEQLFNLLPELSDSFHIQRFVELGKEKPEEDKGILAIQEELRLHTQMVRNWSYLSRVIDITTRLCKPCDKMFEVTAGLSATDIINLFILLIKRVEDKCNYRISHLREVMREKTINGLITAYYKMNPHFIDTEDEFKELIAKQSLKREQVISMLVQHSDLSLPQIYMFTVDEISKLTGYSPVGLNQLLELLSLDFGDEIFKDEGHIFLANPVWTKPIINLGNGKYFCPMPQIFFSYIFQILEGLISGDTKRESIWADRRSKFLEVEICNLFKKSFPGCEIEAAYKWKDGAVEYENDLLVKVDSHLIIVEAKSHSISSPALRGATKRVKKHVEEILLDPSMQSLRLANRIIEAKADIRNFASILQNFPFDISQIQNVLRLSVTLEDFAALQTSIHHFKSAGWIPQEHIIAPCILLADLEVVFDTLETKAHKIHYLKRRSDIEANMSYKGDELDLLGFYLDTGFNIGLTEHSNTHLILTSASKEVDAYYGALDVGIEREKPKPKMTQWWSDICKGLEKRDFYQWSDVANIVLSFAYEEQTETEKRFSQLRKNIHKNWKVLNHLCSIILIPNERKNDAISVYGFKDKAKDERYQKMENIATQIFESSHVTKCLVIAINIDRQDYPYSAIAVYTKPSN